ncbi:uracil-DNA glycosylase [Tissierella sp. MB52-C2]|jgi:uracil-DNA glycosylase|uniref:uracil-DNA glycosylase n=1 Tax=Tissierella sp. MB52-C2 TaxID=3070999 RepID=UPI00280BA67D|nr:uracil-DNA glycosylase [Tissierella sp. MB52-C2]WMM25001.1 uracil-DNA glycosylase [Tissierella sp. MB52-C2]
MKKIFNNDWQELLGSEMEKEYYQKLRGFLIEEYNTRTIYPHMNDIFSALHLTSYKDTKVVILGQDPYHGPNQAYGLAFSVKAGVRIPPSLVNMYKELKDDLGCYIPNNGVLTKWAKEGVLLLNTSLTVRAGEANSHSKIGWQIFTDHIIKLLNERDDPIVFILWGNNAIKKKMLITNPKHYIITSVHPSPLSASRGFFGSKPFSKTNKFLESIGKEPIDWQIENI